MNNRRVVALLIPILGATRAFASADANILFREHCAPCHGVDGKARTPAGRKIGAHDLSESKLTDVEIVKQIMNGKRNDGGVEKMPGFKEKLSPAEIDALVVYVKAFRHH